MFYLHDLYCPECGAVFATGALHTFCTACRSPLLARYDLARARAELDRAAFSARPRGMWRWHELLPVRDPACRLALGEGDCPLLTAPRLSTALGLPHLFIKDESFNPTGSFKARGMAAAVSAALELGVRELVVPTAGNAGGALAAYAARAGLPAHVFMPADAPAANVVEARLYGADVQLVAGLISDAGRLAAAAAAEHGWFDVSTFKEPYRVEGKKIMGYELAEEFGWSLPDVIIYPTGGGTGLVGMWKAFAELAELGWLVDDRRPRMVSVQAAGCAPIVRAFDLGAERAEFFAGAATLAAGLRVPGPFADRLILRSLRESGGTAVAVGDDEILAAQRELAQAEGIFAAPEGAATLAGLRRLAAEGWVRPGERVVLFNTGAGLKYLDGVSA
ncbi:MAG: threonine synthase [Anaerolineales bacterium]|nr:threonine synthase [Anaerolineales bacterium]